MCFMLLGKLPPVWKVHWTICFIWGYGGYVPCIQKGECAMKQITLNKVGYAYDTEWILEDLNLRYSRETGVYC